MLPLAVLVQSYQWSAYHMEDDTHQTFFMYSVLLYGQIRWLPHNVFPTTMNLIRV